MGYAMVSTSVITSSKSLDYEKHRYQTKNSILTHSTPSLSDSLLLEHVIGRLQRVIMRKQLVWIVFVFKRIQPR